jgi:hypothetical protein
MSKPDHTRLMESLRADLIQMEQASLAIASRAAGAALADPPRDFDGEDPVLVFLGCVQAIEEMIRLEHCIADHQSQPPAADRRHLH